MKTVLLLCFLLLISFLHGHEQQSQPPKITEILWHTVSAKGHYNPHEDFMAGIYDSNKNEENSEKFHITVTAVHTNISQYSVLLFLQQRFGKENVCVHPFGQITRSEAFDCLITFLPLPEVQGLEILADFDQLNYTSAERNMLMKVVDPVPPTEKLMDYYFDPNSTLPRPDIFFCELIFGVTSFSYLLKQRYGDKIYLASTFATGTIFLRPSSLSYTTMGAAQIAATLFKVKLAPNTNNPLMMLVNYFAGALGEKSMETLNLVKNTAVPLYFSPRRSMYPWFLSTNRMLTISDDVLAFAKPNVLEPPISSKPEHLHLIGPSIPSQDTSAIPENYSTFMEQAAASNTKVILISMGSQFKLPIKVEAELGPAIVRLINNEETAGKYAVIWRVAKKRQQALSEKLHQLLGTKEKQERLWITSEFMPQRYILSHKATSLFITHCGLGGTTESLAFGKPLLGFPLMAEQLNNCMRIEGNNFGEYLNPSLNITKDQIYDAIIDVTLTRRDIIMENVKRAQRELTEVPGFKSFFQIYKERRAKGFKTLEEGNLEYLQSWIETAAYLLGLFALWISFKVLKFLVMLPFKCCCKRRDAKQVKTKTD